MLNEALTLLGTRGRVLPAGHERTADHRERGEPHDLQGHPRYVTPRPCSMFAVREKGEGRDVPRLCSLILLRLSLPSQCLSSFVSSPLSACSSPPSLPSFLPPLYPFHMSTNWSSGRPLGHIVLCGKRSGCPQKEEKSCHSTSRLHFRIRGNRHSPKR